MKQVLKAFAEFQEAASNGFLSEERIAFEKILVAITSMAPGLSKQDACTLIKFNCNAELLDHASTWKPEEHFSTLYARKDWTGASQAWLKQYHASDPQDQLTLIRQTFLNYRNDSFLALVATQI